MGLTISVTQLLDYIYKDATDHILYTSMTAPLSIQIGVAYQTDKLAKKVTHCPRYFTYLTFHFDAKIFFRFICQIYDNTLATFNLSTPHMFI